MHTRRLAAILPGFSIFLTADMLFVATPKLAGVERILASPPLQLDKASAQAGPGVPRQVPRYAQPR